MEFGAFLPPFHAPGTDPTLALADDLDLAQRLDELGFDELWVGEHHSAGWGLIGSPEVFLAAAAGRTRRIRLGTGVASLPYHHPFMVATRAAQLDHLTRGRFMLGMGAGSLRTDAHMLGIDPADTRAMTETALAAVVHLLRSAEPLSVSAGWFTLRDARLQLRPYSDLTLAVSSASSPFGMRLAGRHGLDVVAFALARPGSAEEFFAQQWRHLEEEAGLHGRTADRNRWRLVIPVHVARTRKEALDQVRPGYQRWFHDYFGGVQGLPTSAPWLEPGKELEWVVERGGALIGTVEDCVAGVERLQRETGGFGRLLIEVNDWAVRADTVRSLELVARHVAPQFGGAADSLRASHRWATEFGHAQPAPPVPVPAT